MRIVIGLLLLVHGLIHIAIYASPAPDERAAAAFKFGHSWLLSPVGFGETALKATGTPLWIVAGAGFVLAGLAVFGLLPIVWWQPLAIVAASASLVLFGLFWHPWIVAGVAADVAVLVGLLAVSPSSLEQFSA